MIEFKDYNPSNPWTITNESQIVDSAGKVTLNYVPLKGSITIPGYTETTSQSPWLTEFYVDYQDSTTYRTAKGILQFNISAAAQAVSVSYSGVSTVIWAKTLNEIKAFMESYGVSGVTAGTYQLGNYAVNSQGRITAVESLAPGMKNKLINGDFAICQRGANAIPTVSRSRSNGVVTITTSIPHGYAVGDTIQHNGLGGKNYNKTWGITSVPSPTAYTWFYSNAVTLSTGIGSTDSSVSVSTGGIADVLPFNIKIDSEEMTVTAINGLVYTVTRGVNGTTAAAHSSGASVYPGDEATTTDTGGKCLITNRPSFAIPTGTWMYTADRMLICNNTDKPCIVAPQAFTPGQTSVPGEPSQYMRITFAAAPTTGNLYVTQRVEDVRTLAGKKAVLHGYFRSSTTESATLYASQNFGVGGSAMTGAGVTTFTFSTDFAQHPVAACVFPSVAGKTFNANHYIEAALGLAPRSAATYDLALMQLEEGSVATPFERRHPATELALCQRYYEKSYDTDTVTGKITSIGQVTWIGNGTSSYHQAPVYFKITKRATPTVTIFNPATGATSSLRDSMSSTDISANAGDFGLQKFQMLVNNISLSNVALCGHYTADAEL